MGRLRYDEMRVIDRDGNVKVVKDPHFERYSRVKKITEYTRNKKGMLGGIPPQQRDERKEAILNALSEQGLTANELSQSTGIASKFVFEHLIELELGRKISRYRGKYYAN